MKFGNFEVNLIRKTNGNYFSERIIDSIPYVVAIPGEEYEVKVTAKRDPRTGLFPAALLRVGLYVDGEDVHYWKRLETENVSGDSMSTVFRGFKTNSVELRSFVFSKSEMQSEQNTSCTPEPLGRIRVVVFECEIASGVFNNQSGSHNIPPPKHSDPNQKFWQRASVTTTAGTKVDPDLEKFNPIKCWRNKTDKPLSTILLHYHTIELLDILDRISTEVGQNTNKRGLEDNTIEQINSKRGRDSLAPKGEDDEQSEIKYIPKTKIVPYVDFTENEDEPLFSYVKETK